MKRYYNTTTREWYYEGQSITRDLENGGFFSGVPSEQRLRELGFEEWHHPEPTPEQLLERAKASKIAELEAYDLSDAVDNFTIGGNPMWLTVDERQQIATQITANESAGRTEMTRWFGGHDFTFPLEVWKQMLTALELYAGDAINVTEAHKAAISQMQSIEDVEAYDFTVGYPTQPSFPVVS